MSKTVLMILIAISFVSTSVFAEPVIEIGVSSENIRSLDSIFIVGKITGVSEYKPVKITVMSPDGGIVYAPLVAIDDNREFRYLMHPPIPSFKAGTYTVTASHAETEITAQTQFTVTLEEMPRNQIIQPDDESMIGEPEDNNSRITMSADAINGSDIIKIEGITSIRNTDITLVVNSPTNNIITIGQVTPDLRGNFYVEIKVGGPLWKEDGIYTITAHQGTASEYKESIKVEIKNGVVIPEFGMIASLVLIISVFAVIMVSAKSKLSIIPKY